MLPPKMGCTANLPHLSGNFALPVARVQNLGVLLDSFLTLNSSKPSGTSPQYVSRVCPLLRLCRGPDPSVSHLGDRGRLRAFLWSLCDLLSMARVLPLNVSRSYPLRWLPFCSEAKPNPWIVLFPCSTSSFTPPSFTSSLFQLHQCRYSSNIPAIFLPQGPCTCCSLCLLFCTCLRDPLLLCFRCLLRSHFHSEAALRVLFKMSTSIPHTFL